MEEDPLFGRKVIDVRKPRKRRLWLWITGAIVALVFLFGSQLVSIYMDALWFASVDYESVYWYRFRLGGLLLVIFLALTFLLVRLPFVLLNRLLPQLMERPKVKFTSVEDFKEINFLPWIYRPGVWILSAGAALIAGINMSQSWPEFALYLHSAPGGELDPIFAKDVSFYLFELPVLELISGWLLTLSVILLAAGAGAAGYIWYIERIRGFGSDSIRRQAVSAISAVGALFGFALAFSTWLDRYDILRAQHELFTGANYIDANVRLPAMNLLVVVLIAASAALLINAFAMRRGKFIIVMAGTVAAVWLIGLAIVPQLSYSFSVKPNELAKESPYILHNIAMTRQAFGLDRFEERPFTPASTVTPQQVVTNQETIDNIRLWDPSQLQTALRQIQEIRTYYDFGIPDVDRYVINGKRRQVMLAARELNVDHLPEQSKTWINQHLVYTHGYGVTMATVNEFTPEGLPHLILKDMPVQSDAPEIKVTRPEIYFGEETTSHVYTHTKPQGGTQPEFNYPAQGNTDSYTEYEGHAGIHVGGVLRKTAMSLYLGDGTNLLFSDYINGNSDLLIHRNVLDRVRQLAPFLLFEQDPYLVINREGRFFWIIDGFTHSDGYPYSTNYTINRLSVNYFRNSVKAVVDAYDGDVKFYMFDEKDPILKTYQSIFPVLFQPASAMPQDLLEHVRYPNLLTSTQAAVYTTYHMTNPQTFYNHEDLWSIATEEAAASGKDAPAPMRPYFVLMQLPGEKDTGLEFVSILPFTPSGGRNNMIGWMAARCDPKYFGQTLVFSFPKNVTINGPAQIRARVNQDPQLSQQMTLWNQQGSRLLRGNLLVIPLGDALLYAEPFYLQAESSPLPELRQVAIATQDRLATGRTFPEALHALFPDLPQQPSGGARPAATTPGQGQQPPGQGAQNPAEMGTPAAPQPAAAGTDVERLARQAQQLLADYERLTAEGKHGEAGQKLDQLKQTLGELNRKRGGG